MRDFMLAIGVACVVAGIFLLMGRKPLYEPAPLSITGGPSQGTGNVGTITLTNGAPKR